MITLTQESLRNKGLSVIPHQFQNATALRALMTALADMLWEELGEPLMEYERWPNPDEMTGRRLDDLGACLGLPRPLISTGTYFAFEGQTGETFAQAPFWEATSALQNSIPISDERYRPFLKWRQATLGGAPTYGELRRGAFNTADGFYGFDNGSVTVSGGTITVSAGTVEGTQEILWDFLKSSQESLSRAMLPRVAGKAYTFS